MEFNLIHLIPMLAMAELSRQIVHESELAQGIKTFFKINHTYSKKWKTLSNPKFYRQFLHKWFWICLPLLLIVMLFSTVMLFLTEMLDCDRCTGFHLEWMMLFFILKYSIIESLVLAPIGIIFIYIIEYLLGKTRL